MKLLSTVIALSLLAILTGCQSITESMGQRDVEVLSEYHDGQLESCRFGYESGTDISSGFDGDISLISSPDRCAVVVSGSGGASKASEGHKATTESIKATGEAVSKITGAISEGAVRGFTGGMP